MKMMKGQMYLLLSLSLTIVSCQKTAQIPNNSSAKNFLIQSIENQSLYGEYNFEKQADGLMGMTRKKLDTNKFGHAAIEYQKSAGKENQTFEKIQTNLKEKLSRSNPSEIVKVIINYRDDVKIPAFPVLNQKNDFSNKTSQIFAAQTDDLISGISAERASQYRHISEEISSKYGGKVTDTFWLINAVTAEVPLGQINSIASDSNVLNITEANLTEVAPITVADGRTAMGTDTLKSWIQFQYNTPVALIDTGVAGPSPHVLLNQYMIKKDCTSNSSCSGGDPYENYLCNHGTSSAAIIAGNGNLGNNTLGVFNRTIFSYKEGVISQDANGTYYCGTQYQGTIYGIQRAVADGTGVIVVETQFPGSPADSLSTAVNNAFDAGRAVIAANGNFNTNGSPGTVRYPAGAHKALGIGAIDLPGGNTAYYQSLGPTPDNRIKPDIQAPTCANTAASKDSSGNPSTTALKIFCGTSGSTPFAGGAAAIMYDYMHYSFPQVNMALPTYVYANLIASGNSSSGAFNNTTGAGQISFPSNQYSVGGGATFNLISNGDYYDCTVNVNPYYPVKKIKGAIWWAESPTMPHSDIDLKLISPTGTLLASSNSISSIFEKVEYGNAGQLPDGDYTLRVSAYSVKSYPLIACASIVEN